MHPTEKGFRLRTKSQRLIFLVTVGVVLAVLVKLATYDHRPREAASPSPPAQRAWVLLQPAALVPAVPVVNTNGVPVPNSTPYDDRPSLKVYYLACYCDAYRSAVKSGGMTTRCLFSNGPFSDEIKAEQAGWWEGMGDGVKAYGEARLKTGGARVYKLPY
jgi:hypothetical protein